MQNPNTQRHAEYQPIEPDEATSVVDARDQVAGDISVAITHPGSRVDKIAIPLEASEMDVSIDPSDAYEHDIVLVDKVDQNLGREVLRKPLHGAKVVYRMRGDVFRERKTWEMHPVKKWAAINVVLRNVDGVVAVTDLLAEKIKGHANVPVGSAGLCKVPEQWPTAKHTDHELRIVTLTNANYKRKIQPLLEWAPIVNDVLKTVGGRWHICGDGTYDDLLIDRLEPHSHVFFQGHVDAHEELSAANLMIHASRLDGQPNGMLEGLASGLPVVTNPFPEFLEFGWPLDVATSPRGLQHQLQRYTDPEIRATRGRAGIEYLEEHHSTDAIARDYERYFAELLYGGQHG